ncbi:MAG: crossover junction endodeoxyribonuclease RuvC [candidate division WOR-3 bacterium]
MRILGLDPGLAATGYGVIEGRRLIECGVIVTNLKDDLPERLRQLAQGLEQVVRRTRPRRCAVETLFFRAVGAKSVILSAESRGALLCVLARHRIPVTELTPATIKLALTGNGRAAKRQVKFMVRSLLGIDGRIHEHAADALAAACCLSRRGREI